MTAQDTSNVEDHPPWFLSTLGYASGVEVFRQGQTLATVWRVESGIVKLVSTAGDGTDTILALVLPGEWMGTAAAIAETSAPTSAITCVHSVLHAMSAAQLRHLLQHDAALSLEIHRAHAKALCSQTDWMTQLRTLSARQRLERVIRRLVLTRPIEGVHRRVHLPIRYWELAKLIGVTAEHLSRLLRQLEQSDVIHRSQGWIVVADLNRLSSGDSGDEALDAHQPRD
jgi:CRP-like cAMP-binding protein